jgi:hypothetical protein
MSTGDAVIVVPPTTCTTVRSVATEVTTCRVANKALKQKRTSIAVGAGELPEPKSMVEALMSDRAEGWVESIHKEMQGLIDQGVFTVSQAYNVR